MPIIDTRSLIEIFCVYSKNVKNQEISGLKLFLQLAVEPVARIIVTAA
jgi:hypothetical protein